MTDELRKERERASELEAKLAWTERKLHAHDSHSCSDIVQSEAAWEERAQVAEIALEELRALADAPELSLASVCDGIDSKALEEQVYRICMHHIRRSERAEGKLKELTDEGEATLDMWAKERRVTIAYDGNIMQRVGGSAQINLMKLEGELKKAKEELESRRCAEAKINAALDQLEPEIERTGDQGNDLVAALTRSHERADKAAALAAENKTEKPAVHYMVDAFTEASKGTKFPENSWEAETVEQVADMVHNCSRRITGIVLVQVWIIDPHDMPARGE